MFKIQMSGKRTFSVKCKPKGPKRTPIFIQSVLVLPIIFAPLSSNPLITENRNESVESPASRVVSPEAKQSRDKAN